MIGLYLDEDSMDHDLVRALRARGLDVTTALLENMIDQDDAAHLDYATKCNRVLFSFNRGDYFQLHAEYLIQGKSHAGIILANQQRYSVGEAMRRIVHLAASVSAEAMWDRVEFLSAWS